MSDDKKSVDSRSGDKGAAGDRTGPAPHVVMLVGNDLHIDTRVKKEALALARAGLRITVVAENSGSEREMAMLGPVTVIRVPVPRRLYNEQQRRRAARRAWRPPLIGRDNGAARQATELKLRLARRRLQGARGRAAARAERLGPLGPIALVALGAARRGAVLVLRARLFALRARGGIRRRVDNRLGRAWEGYDEKLTASGFAASWRRVVPEAHDYELAFGPVVDELDPDVIHAHDMHMPGVAARAVERARARGRRVRWVYDAHEYVGGLSQYGRRTARVVAGWRDLERAYIRRADRVITISDHVADRLAAENRLSRRPTLVLNVAAAEDPNAPRGPTVREATGLEPGVPFAVYSGVLTPARGVDLAIDALDQLPDVHLAIVCVPHTEAPHARRLRAHAAKGGLAERVHFLDPVASAQVTRFMSGADVGLHPGRRDDNFEITLPNKLFEYLQAGIPQVVSDMRGLGGFVAEHRIGEVFTAGDVDDLARALRVVLGDRDRYLAAVGDPGLLDRFSWRRQEASLRGLYEDLLGIPLPDHGGDVGSAGLLSLAERPIPPASPRALGMPTASVRRRDGGGRYLAIAPANMAGQGWAWAKAVERQFPGVRTEVFDVDRGWQRFRIDWRVPAKTFAHDRAWQIRQARHAFGTYTHVLMESARPVLGAINGDTFVADVEPLREAGIAVAVVLHGSEVRDPRVHGDLYPFSPFQDPADPLTTRLQEVTDKLLPLIESFDGPKFVSTPDLLDFVPDAVWLPVVVDTRLWRPGPAPLERPVPVVVHAPSNPPLKGSALIEPALRQLDERGLIDYRRLDKVPSATMPELIGGADIVLDHFVIGNYGVLACEAMAAGRVTVSHVHERVRSRVGRELPVIEATPDDLTGVIEQILDDRPAAQERAARGPGFVRALHDGARSAQALRGFLDLDRDLDGDGQGRPGALPATAAAVETAPTETSAEGAAEAT